jgi:hypothetical protein
VPAAFEASYTCSLLDEVTALRGARGKDLLYSALPDHGDPAAEADVGEQLDDVDAADCGAVHEVLALAATV